MKFKKVVLNFVFLDDFGIFVYRYYWIGENFVWRMYRYV